MVKSLTLLFRKKTTCLSGNEISSQNSLRAESMSLQIIGAGFGRTGTNSLKLALEHLGFGPCHHMFEIRDNPELLADWVVAARGEKIDWDRVFRGYRRQVLERVDPALS
jgi:sulfotransferase family protein